TPSSPTRFLPACLPSLPLTGLPVRPYLRRMNLRRVLSLLMLVAAIVSVLEPVVGEARDAEIHHEEQVTIASFHQIHSPADHSHEGPAQSQHPQSGSHQHGSSSDHCTH